MSDKWQIEKLRELTDYAERHKPMSIAHVNAIKWALGEIFILKKDTERARLERDNLKDVVQESAEEVQRILGEKIKLEELLSAYEHVRWPKKENNDE